MDRNLGALRNIWSTESSLESARAYGNLYQGGRKDPMPGSADGGRDDIDLMFDGNGVSIKFIVEKDSKNYNLAYSIEHPAIFLPSSIDNIGWSASKTIYDPCPAGWQVPAWGNESNNNIWSDFKSNSIGLANTDKMLVNGNWTKVASITVTANDFNIMNGIRYKLSDDDSENNYAWFPFIRMRERGTGLLRDPYRNDGNGAEQDFNQNILPASFLYGITFKAGECWYSEMKYTYASGTNLTNAYGLGVRCIQQ